MKAGRCHEFRRLSGGPHFWSLMMAEMEIPAGARNLAMTLPRASWGQCSPSPTPLPTSMSLLVKGCGGRSCAPPVPGIWFPFHQRLEFTLSNLQHVCISKELLNWSPMLGFSSSPKEK